MKKRNKEGIFKPFPVLQSYRPGHGASPPSVEIDESQCFFDIQWSAAIRLGPMQIEAADISLVPLVGSTVLKAMSRHRKALKALGYRDGRMAPVPLKEKSYSWEGLIVSNSRRAGPLGTAVALSINTGTDDRLAAGRAIDHVRALAMLERVEDLQTELELVEVGPRKRKTLLRSLVLATRVVGFLEGRLEAYETAVVQGQEKARIKIQSKGTKNGRPPTASEAEVRAAVWKHKGNVSAMASQTGYSSARAFRARAKALGIELSPASK